MQIESYNTNQKVLLIAEIGNNHEGDFSVAQRLVEAAVEAGVGAVKFQTFIPELYVNTTQTERFERLKKFQLSFKQFEQLSRQAHDANVLFISTPLDLESAAFLPSIVDAIKVGSGENTFYPLLTQVALGHKPVIVSTGLSTLPEIAYTKAFLEKALREAETAQPIALLHCVSAYPTPAFQANLGAITALQRAFPDTTIGYSDHTVGRQAALTAVALGAQIIEKHFTLDNQYSSFRDHQLSLNPIDMALLVKEIQDVEAMMAFTPVPECSNAALMRRSIVARQAILPDKPLSLEDFTWVRPAEGLPPGQEHRLLGRRLKAPAEAGTVMTEALLQ
jgi:sialic acid synthase SpsE